MAEQIKKQMLDASIMQFMAETNLDVRSCNCLCNAKGLTTVRDLLQMGSRDFAYKKNVGRATILAVTRALSANGLHWQREKSTGLFRPWRE